MACGRKVHDEGEARRCLAAARRAGQAAGEWARAHGIDGRSLHAWSVNLAGRSTAGRSRRAPPPSSHALVELVPEESCGGPTARYVLVVDDARLEFGDDASASTLRRVLEALRAC
jgi:hypothetical protein